jgi:hypothetical protein
MRQTAKAFSFGLLCFILLSVFSAQAQIIHLDTLSPWKKLFKAGLNLNQASFSNNWKAGGVNSVGFNTFLNYVAGYSKGPHSWDNQIDLQYGMVNNAGQGYRKTIDRAFLDTKYGHSINKKWDVFFALNFLSQFAKGYKYEKDANGIEQSALISNMLAPAFITSSWGLEYHPAAYFKVRFAPFAPRLTIVQHNDGRYAAVDSIKPYGVPVGKDTRFEWLAFQMLAEFNKDIAKNLNLKWRYMMFANYQTLDLKTIDHRLDLNITAKVNQFINVTLGGILLYDYDQDPGAQISQAFSLGVLYSVQNYKDK